ncbi:MAG: tetratricopeptide repeat protein [Anaerolineae bacterium]|nr:tetratricopeptide repeat protein [Anaerolineae bacterium]
MSNEQNWLEFFADRERLYADYYLAFAQQHARRDSTAYDHLEAESGNLLRTASWLAEQNETGNILKLADVLWQQSGFLRSRGFLQRGLPLLEQAQQAAHALGDVRTEFIWLEALAFVYWDNGNHASALPLYEQALALLQDNDEPLCHAQANLGMGRLQIDMGHLEKANTLLLQALQDYHHIRDQKGELETLIALANLSSLQGNPDKATTYLEQALSLTQARQDLQNEANLQYTLGYVNALAGKWSEAAIHFSAAIKTAHAAGDILLEVRGMTALGEAWLVQGDAQQAVNLLQKALACQETNDDILHKAFTQVYLAKGYNILNQPEQSLVQLRQVYPYLLDLRQAPIMATLAVEAAWIMADNYLKQNNPVLAQAALHDILLLNPDPKAKLYQTTKALLESIG